MIQTVILEDRPLHREEMLSMLGRWPQAESMAVHCAAGAEELRQLAARGQVNILLTDIDLGAEGPDGIALVEELFPPESGTQIIYFTGYPLRFCTRVYRTEHIYFLTKPLEQEPLFDALDRALERLAHREERRVLVQNGGRVIPLFTGEILYVESDRRLARFYTDGGTVECYRSLSALLPQLGPGFVQCHKSFLVNMSRVRQMEPGGFRLRSGVLIPISQSHKKAARAAYLHYLAERL